MAVRVTENAWMAFANVSVLRKMGFGMEDIASCKMNAKLTKIVEKAVFVSKRATSRLPTNNVTAKRVILERRPSQLKVLTSLLENAIRMWFFV